MIKKAPLIIALLILHPASYASETAESEVSNDVVVDAVTNVDEDIAGNTANDNNARPSAHTDAQASLYSDSDDLEVQQYSLGYKQGESIFDYRHEQDRVGDTQWGVKIQRNRINQRNEADYSGYAGAVNVSHKFSDGLSLAGAIGRSQLENSIKQADDALTTYDVQARLRLNPQLELHADHKKDYLFNDAIVEDDNGKLLSGRSSDVSLQWRPQKKIRVQGGVGHRSLSDGNQSDKVSGAVLYGISPDWPWIWTGVSAEHLSYDQDKASYWTPDTYTSYGVVVDSNFPVNDKVSLSLGGNLNRSKEDKNPAGTGYALSAGANWNVTENVDLDINGYVLKSSQEASDWKQDQVRLSLRVKSY